MPMLHIAMPYQGERELRLALALLTAANVRQMRERPLPPLYHSRVRQVDRHDVEYTREARGHEEWQTAILVHERGEGDCEDLACYRAAELYVSGADRGARAIPMRTRAGWHIVVQRTQPSRTIEDPSKILGMGRERRPR